MDLRLIVTAGATDDSIVQLQFENVMVIGAMLPVPTTSAVTLRQLDHYLVEFGECRGLGVGVLFLLRVTVSRSSAGEINQLETPRSRRSLADATH